MQLHANYDDQIFFPYAKKMKWKGIFCSAFKNHTMCVFKVTSNTKIGFLTTLLQPPMTSFYLAGSLVAMVPQKLIEVIFQATAVHNLSWCGCTSKSINQVRMKNYFFAGKIFL